MAEQVNERTGRGDEITEGIVGVLRNDIAVGIKVARNISVIVIARNVD